MKYYSFLLFLATIITGGCKPGQDASPSVNETTWGIQDGKDIHLVTLANKNGMVVKITNLGGIITSILVPDKNGKPENVVLGFDSLSGYQGENPYFGSIVGRYANRIGGAQFTLNGITYKLNANDHMNTLHGGLVGFNKKVFDIDSVFSNQDSAVLKLSYLSPDMEEGFPGNLLTRVTYILTGEGEIRIEYDAETDKPTVINLTNHSYFNLTGCKENILSHELLLLSDSITPGDSTLIPTGKLAPVAGTAFDFNIAHKIGDKINEVPGGYDINFKLRNMPGELVKAAEVYEPVSGRLLQVSTTEPGIQFYTGNFLNGSIAGSHGIKYEKHDAFCLEAQHFPDSPNKPQFPDVVLQPGETYRQVTIYRFTVR